MAEDSHRFFRWLPKAMRDGSAERVCHCVSRLFLFFRVDSMSHMNRLASQNEYQVLLMRELGISLLGGARLIIR